MKKIVKIQYFLLLLYIIHFSPKVAAQTTPTTSLPVNLETVLQLAGADNLHIQQTKYRLQLAQAEQTAAREWLLPNVYAGLQLHKLTGNVMNGDGRIFTDVNRDNFWGGLGLTAEWNLGDNLYKALAAKQKTETIKYQNKALKITALLKAVHAYFDLQSEQQKQQTLKELVNQSDNITQQIEVQVLAGNRYKSELLLAKSNEKHLEVAIKKSEIALHRQSATLINTLNLKDNIQLLVADSTLAPLQLVEGGAAYQLDNIYNKRPEFLAIQSNIKAIQKESQQLNKGLLLPSLRLQASDAAFGAAFNTIKNTFDITGGAFWQIPLGQLFFGGSKKKYEAQTAIQKIELEKVQNQVNEEISAAKSALLIASEQLELAREGLEFSQEALRQSIGRQAVRTAKPYEVFQAQEYFLRSKIDYIEAIRDYNKAQYSLYVALGNDL